ncbi:MAG TPA: histidine kinase [Flavitalea sp.]|nr:histidine kinase [Flavitalea sp.]
MKVFWKYIFPILFGLIIYTSIRLVNDIQGGFQFWKRPFHTNAIEIGSVIIVSYMIQFLLDYFIRQFNKRTSPGITGRTILREFVTVYLACAILLNCTIIPMVALTDDGLQLNDFVITNILPILYVLLYFAIVRGNYYLKAYVDNKLQLEKITNDQLQTELKFLKAQYHPHFLFNALNTIYFQMDENVGDAKKSVEKFSDLLRYQLYDQQQTVSVGQEINYLKNFIELQKVRSSDKLKLEVSFDPSLKGQQVYPLLFLPLVENAFKYIGGEYEMSVTAKKSASGIDFEVVNSIPVGEVPVREGGIGLENLKRRLHLLYPGKHELTLQKNNSHFIALLKLNANAVQPIIE